MGASRQLIICFIVFLLFAGIGTYWTRLGQALYTNEQRFYMSEFVNGEASSIERSLTRTPLFQILFVHHSMPDQQDSLGDTSTLADPTAF